MAGFREGPQSAGKVWQKSVKAKLEKLECSPVTRFRQKIEPRGFPAVAQRSFPSTVNYHSKLFGRVSLVLESMAWMARKLICNLNIGN